MKNIEDINKAAIKKIVANKKITDFSPGDTIKVGVKIIEGKRERIQYFEGVCIAKKNRDINSSFTVRKISFGEGVERTFALYSPNVDSIKVGVKIVEGKRERVQYFEGVCIAKKNRDINSSFTVRKISFGEGVERTFALYSPNVDSIKVIRSGKVRRAKLYYLRDRKGKSARIAEKIKKKIGVDVSVKLEEPKAGPSAELKKEDKTNEEKKTPLKSETKTEKPTTEKNKI